MTEVTPLPAPNLLEIVQGAWPAFWGINKMIWPLWVIILILALIKLGLWILGKKIDKWKLNKTMKKCPQCTEMVPIEAKKCKFCGSDV